MPKWPFQWLSKEFPCDPATKEALRRIEEARKSGASHLDLSKLKLSTLPEAIGQLSQLQQLNLVVTPASRFCGVPCCSRMLASFQSEITRSVFRSELAGSCAARRRCCEEVSPRRTGAFCRGKNASCMNVDAPDSLCVCLEAIRTAAAIAERLPSRGLSGTKRILSPVYGAPRRATLQSKRSVSAMSISPFLPSNSTAARRIHC
jgi:hypothetical protein